MELPTVVVGAAGHHRAVTVLPLFTPDPGAPAAYRLGSDALAAGALEIRELDGGGAVDRLRARNRGRERVLLLEGDHLIGAKQNRVLTSSALVGGKRELTLPVSCVEQGRWRADSAQFAASATMAPAGVRRIVKLSVTRALLDFQSRRADQSQIWSSVAAQQSRLHVRSATAALAHTYAAHARDLDGAATRLPYVAGATGIALGVGDELMSIDLFDQPATCAAYWRRLVGGAVLEALGRPVGGGIGDTCVQRIVDQLRAAAWAPVTPIGDGQELRATTIDAAASALVLDGRLVHFGVATGMPAPAMAAPGRRAVAWQPMRRELPAELAERYTIVARIGVGGAKEVFRATDRDGREVAIARLPGVDPHQFASEVELARRVAGYVPEIYESLVDRFDDGYLVMEYCDGKSLAALAERALPVADAGPILVELARAVDAIHRAHVLHRDLKLENVVLCNRGDRAVLKVLDFGMSARARNETSALIDIAAFGGTVPYMPREVIRGTEVDARSDVYSLGVCCFRLLTGELPAPPGDRESEYQYIMRLAQIERHDLANLVKLPALPAPVRELIARMLHPERVHRPFMPEVVAGFERAFGGAAIAIPRPAPPPVPARAARLERAWTAALAVTPEQVLVAPCARAPIAVLIRDNDGTIVRALGPDGRERWSRRVPGRLDRGLRADLDNDGVRELYLAGPCRLVALDAAGEPRFDRALGATGTPALLAIPDPETPRLVVDGELVDTRGGTHAGRLTHAYEGIGDYLVAARDLRGVAFNGYALQAFRGSHETGAAIIGHPGARSFHVAQLEDVDGAVELGIYGPGGQRVHRARLAEPEPDRMETSALIPLPWFPHVHDAPIAALASDGTAIVIAPLFQRGQLIAIELPSGRELWRAAVGHHGRALLGDPEGTGAPVVVVGDGGELRGLELHTGRVVWTAPSHGLPVACGDPFGTGAIHLVVAVHRTGLELWRGGSCRPGAMQWSGIRADLWNTGALRATGEPYGPV